MTFPIQRQSEAYGVFDDDSLHFAKEYHTRDLPDGLVNMLKGARITAGMNNPRGRTAGDFDAQYDYSQPSVSDLHAHDPHQMGHEEYEQENLQDPQQFIPGSQVHDPRFQEEQQQLPGGFGVGGYDDFDPHSVENLPYDHLAQFRPHLASFTEAHSQHTAEDGPTPGPGLLTPMMFQPRPPSLDSMLMGGEKAFANDQPHHEDRWVTAAAVQPQVVPGWIGHGYAPGHRVGLPWRGQNIPGIVTHLDGQAVGVRWDDGQHSTEEPSDLRPL